MNNLPKIIDYIAYGDKRTVAGVAEVVRLLDKEPKQLKCLFEAINQDDEPLNMRALDAIEKASRDRYTILQPYKKNILNDLMYYQQKEVRWHVAQLLPRLKLTKLEFNKVLNYLITEYLVDPSSIVKSNTLTALYELREQDFQAVEKFMPVIESAVRNGTKAMQARYRKLFIAQL